MSPAPAAARQNVPHPGLCFGAGLLVTLVLGVGLGALNLFKADWAAGEVSGESILVHAHAQIFGFVVLFVVGIVGHALPRISRQPLDRPWLLWLAFGATLLGQLLFPAGTFGHFEALARAAEALDLAAALALAAAVWGAVRRAPPSLRPWLRLGSLALVAAAGWGLLGALDGRLLLARPALWQLALWGFIAPFIFGMSYHVLDMAGGLDVREALRALPVAGGVRLAYPALAAVAYASLNGAVALRMARVWAATVNPAALHVSGVSGFAALTALLCFGACLFGTARRVLARQLPAMGAGR